MSDTYWEHSHKWEKEEYKKDNTVITYVRYHCKICGAVKL